MSHKPRLLVISHVLPFPRNAGQHQRVFYKLKAAHDAFHVTFLTAAPQSQHRELKEKLLVNYCDEVILLPSEYLGSRFAQLRHKVLGTAFAFSTSLKLSNYVIGEVEFAPSRLETVLAQMQFDCALYEYWHAFKSVRVLQAKGIPCILDMHDVLWHSYERQLSMNPAVPSWWKQRAVAKYKHHEEDAWTWYDGLIAINAAEGDYARQIVGQEKPILYAPMGTDLSTWPYSWEPAKPARFAYYGGMGTLQNQEAALRGYQLVMPLIWEACPDAQYWIVGSNPSTVIQKLAESDPRVIVTGFVEQVQDVLKTMTAVLCPWTGTFGFRSRLIEVMGLGVPVVVTPDGVYGMDMDDGQGIFLRESDQGLASLCIDLAQKPDFARQQSQLARKQVEEKFSYEATYEHLAQELVQFASDASQALANNSVRVR